VTAPANTPIGKVLGTTAVGTWGPIDAPAPDEVLIQPTEPTSRVGLDLWVDSDANPVNPGAGGLPAGGGTMTGPLILAADPQVPMAAATKQYVDAHTFDQTSADARYVNTAGDAMTGLLTLSGPPTADLHAATKGYIDAKFWTGTKAQYDAISQKYPTTLYVIVG
jgi:hypothetical protein